MLRYWRLGLQQRNFLGGDTTQLIPIYVLYQRRYFRQKNHFKLPCKVLLHAFLLHKGSGGNSNPMSPWANAPESRWSKQR